MRATYWTSIVGLLASILVSIGSAGGQDSTAGHDVIDVTDGRFADTDPVFTADGLYLAFLSVRSFDPVYDAHSFDMSFPFGSRPYLVSLAAHTPSPFGPLPEGRQPGRQRAARGASGESRMMVRISRGQRGG